MKPVAPILWLFAASLAGAGDSRAIVTGSVSDGSSAVASAEVSILSTAVNEIVSTKTDSSGRFRAEIAAGSFEIYVRAPGFAVASSSGSVRPG